MPSSPTSTARAKLVARWILLVVGGVAAIWAVRHLPLQDWLRSGLDAVARLGPWGPALFILIYLVATVLLVPGSALTLGAGALFGVAWGSVYVSIASTLGATCAFLLGRHAARGAVTRRIAADARFAAMDEAVAEEGWKIVGLMRLSPVFPFTLLNYAFGLTRVRLMHYVLASWIGMMPGTVLYVYLGSLAQAAAGQRTRSAAEWTLYAAGLGATAGVTVVITRIARRALAQRIAPPDTGTARKTG